MKFFAVQGMSKPLIAGLFLIKICFGLLLWAIYTFYYKDRSTADIYKYFDDSKILFDALKSHPIHYFKMLTGIGNTTPEFDTYYNQMHYWARKVDSSVFNDSHAIIRFNAFVRLFSYGYYNVHTVVMCFLSLIGLTAIYKTFIPFLKDKNRELICAVYLLPSVMFWGSGVLKEGLIFFALGLLIYFTTKLFSLKAIMICLATTLLLALSKFYVWLAILPCLVFIFWLIKTNHKHVWLKYGIIFILFCGIGLNIETLTGLQSPLVTLSQKQIEFNSLATGNATDAYNKPIPTAGSIIKINTLEPTLSSFMHNAPQAIVNTMFRPYLWESKSPLMLMAGLENLIIIIFIIMCIIFMKPLKEVRWEFVLFCLSFVLFQFLIIGETTPVIGAIARYKVSALPFLLIGFLFILDKGKMQRVLKRGNKMI
jgi:hypothetical protein